MENNRIKLNAPWDKGYVPARTKMSQRSSGITFIFNFKALQTLQTSWENISRIQSGLGSSNTTRFWNGTRYIKLSWWNNYQYTANTTVDFKDIYIREVTE